MAWGTTAAGPWGVSWQRTLWRMKVLATMFATADGTGEVIFGGELQLPDLKGGHGLVISGVPHLMGISGLDLAGRGPLPRPGVWTMRLQTFSFLGDIPF